MSNFSDEDIYKKLLIFGSITIIVFGLLIFKLLWIQTVYHREYSEAAEKQRVKEFEVYPCRGIIYDRNLIPLTNTNRQPTLFVYKNIIQDNKKIIDEIKNITGKSEESIKKLMENQNSIVEIPLMKGVIDEGIKPNGTIILNKTIRHNEKRYLTHVIGNINESENVGVSGIEKVFDDILKLDNSYGSISVQVDGKKRMIPGLGYMPVNKSKAIRPNSVKLTIDYHIQKEVEDILDSQNKNGAVIVADVETGEILAMASRPNMNIKNISNESDKMDCYNKAIQVGYPPASIFKIIVLAAALEEEKVSFDEIFICKGYEQVENIIIKCHSYNKGGHGEIDIREAFYDSCNSVFIQLGKRIGSEKIIQTARRLGFGSKCEIGLIEEINGNLPEGDELKGPAIGNISIGQGEIEVTPLQVTNLMLTIANGGICNDITIIDSIVTEEGYKVKEFKKNKPKRVIDTYYSYIIKNFMEDVVTKGTAKGYISLEDIGGAAGKTGTAQAIYNGKETKHAWFSGYFPKKKPKYVITVLIEEGTSGGGTAGPIFEKIARSIVKYQ